MSSSMRLAITSATGSRGRTVAVSGDRGARTVARLAVFPTIVFPGGGFASLAAPPLLRRSSVRQFERAVKIDNSIVNNIECSYHPKKYAVSSQAKHANTDGDNGRKEGGIHEGSGQEFRLAGAVEAARPPRVSHQIWRPARRRCVRRGAFTRLGCGADQYRRALSDHRQHGANRDWLRRRCQARR